VFSTLATLKLGHRPKRPSCEGLAVAIGDGTAMAQPLVDGRNLIGQQGCKQIEQIGFGPEAPHVPVIVTIGGEAIDSAR
jgi:hypothetical protein